MVDNSQTWRWSSQCQGLGCQGLSVMVVVIIVIIAVAAMAIMSCFIVSAVRKRRAYKRGVVPATRLLSGAQRQSKNGGTETIEKYELKMKRIPVREAGADNVGAVVREESCPVCLKAVADIKILVELGCTHQICESCMKRIVRADRLHTRCPLCREHLLTEKEGVEEEACCRGPVAGEVEMRVHAEVGPTRESVDENRRVEFGGGDRSRWMVV